MYMGKMRMNQASKGNYLLTPVLLCTPKRMYVGRYDDQLQENLLIVKAK